MSAHPRRVLLAPGYILHHRPYRDSSRILEVLVRDHGRLTLFARGVRGPKPRFGGVLQPFDLLLLSFQVGREAGQLTGAESAESSPALPAGSLMAAFYLNELLLKLTTQHDPVPEVFGDYRRALAGLRSGGRVEGVLRVFEKRLLEEAGYGVDLTSEARTGKAIEAEGFYRFQASHGLIPAREGEADAVAGSSLLALAREELGEGRTLEDARRVLKAALAERLEGKELATRRVARALAGARPR
ncbi:MAG: DNA repair protein RecO [Steroidobacteraceae bacterium]